MTIAVSDSKEIILNNEVVSFYQFRTDFDKYKETVRPLFRASAFLVKSEETWTEYLSRLFYLLYYKKGYRADVANTAATSHSAGQVHSAAEYDLLNALGITVIKHCPKTSKIVFKTTGQEYKIYNDKLDDLIDSVKTKNTIKRNKKEIKFGVELEFVASYSRDKINEFSNRMINLVGKDRYSCEMCYHHNNGNQWELGRDGSVRSTGKMGFELTSPIFTYGNKKDMNELQSVIDLVHEVLDGKTNKSCGTHVHMSFDCNVNADQLKMYFAQCYHDNEKDLFDPLVPETRRENNNQYSRSCYITHISDRYRKLNLCHVKNNTKNMHVEFRQLDGTLDYNKLVSWIKLQKLFIEVSLDNATAKNIADCKSKKINFKDVICDKSFTETEVESLLSMSKTIA